MVGQLSRNVKGKKSEPGITLSVQRKQSLKHSVVEKGTFTKGSGAKVAPLPCENHVRELRTFFTVVLEPNIHTFRVLSETLPDFPGKDDRHVRFFISLLRRVSSGKSRRLSWYVPSLVCHRFAQ